MRHLVFVTIYRWLSGMQGGISFRPAYQTVICVYRVTNTRCRIGTVFSPDDVHTVARNMYRKAIKILRKFVHQVGSIYKISLFKLLQPKKGKPKCFCLRYEMYFWKMKFNFTLPVFKIYWLSCYWFNLLVKAAHTLLYNIFVIS